MLLMHSRHRSLDKENGMNSATELIGLIKYVFFPEAFRPESSILPSLPPITS